jgi:prepilin-type N-terminal cleavage/methylation domain-containing protein
MRTSNVPRRTAPGFTLVEMIFTIVLLGVFAQFAMMKLLTPATMTLPAQAQSLADVIRRAQSLAVVRGERTRASVTTPGANGRVDVACPASAPCNTDTSITVSQGVVLAGASSVYFNSLGQPVNSAGTALTADTVFTLSYTTGGSPTTYTVTVAALTGRVSVSP